MDPTGPIRHREIMDLERMDRLITATENRLRRAWLLSFVAQLRADNPEDALADRIRAGHADPLVGIRDAAVKLAVGWHAAYIAAGQTAAGWLASEMSRLDKRDAIAKQLPVFDPAAPPALHWMSQNRLDLIREIEAETRILVRDVLMEGARLGMNPLDVARDLRNSIGLTAHQEQIISNYRAELMRGDYSAALQRQLSSGASDRAIAAAARAQRPLTQAQIDTAVERYRNNYIDMRARTIARTEGLRVAHQGSDELYRQAIENGDVEADQIEQIWHHAGRGASRAGKGKSKGKGKSGDRPFHVVMDGQKRPFGEPFVSGIGGHLRYPCDPEAPAEETINCRCVKTTHFIPSGGAGSSGGARAPASGRGAAADTEAIEEVAVADEAALEAEAEALAEEQAAAVEAAEQAALERELGLVEPELEQAEIADLLGVEPIADEEVTGLALTPEQQRHQHFVEAKQRLAAKEAELARARADVARLEDEAAAAEREVGGFRIGVTSEIAGETELDEIAWLAEQRGRVPAARALDAESPLARAPEPLQDPYRTAADGPDVIPSSKPAPVGFDAVEFKGETYYRQVVTGRAYTAADMAERQSAAYVIELRGPNVQTPGFDTLEVKTPSMTTGQTRYRGPSGATYTAEDLANGYARAQEEFFAHPPAERKPGLLSRIFRKLWL